MKLCSIIAWLSVLICGACDSPLTQNLPSPRPVHSTEYPLLNTVPERIAPCPPHEVERTQRALEQKAAELRKRASMAIAASKSAD